MLFVLICAIEKSCNCNCTVIWFWRERKFKGPHYGELTQTPNLLVLLLILRSPAKQRACQNSRKLTHSIVYICWYIPEIPAQYCTKQYRQGATSDSSGFLLDIWGKIFQTFRKFVKTRGLINHELNQLIKQLKKWKTLSSKFPIKLQVSSKLEV